VGNDGETAVTPFHWKIAGAVTLGWTALLAVRCAIFGDALRACMRTEMFSTVVVAMHVATWMIGGWLGVETANHFKRPWVGWIVGIASVVALASLLFWLGFDLPSDDSYGENDHYRR
jgi:hypothetical protein